MFHRAAAYFVLALPVLAAANAVPRTDSVCQTGTAQCCNSVQSTSSTAVLNAVGMLSFLDQLLYEAAAFTGNVGLGCTLLNVGTCSQANTCCTGNTFNSAVTVGCISIAP